MTVHVVREPGLRAADLRLATQSYRDLLRISVAVCLWSFAAFALSLITRESKTLTVTSGASGAISFAVVMIGLGMYVGYRDHHRDVAHLVSTLVEEEVSSEAWGDVRPAPEGSGYVYVLRFRGGTVKAGQSIDPARRLGEHRRDARAYGIIITDVWISDPHTDYLANEISLLSAIAGAHRGDRSKREYFHGADFNQVVRFATELTAGPTPP